MTLNWSWVFVVGYALVVIVTVFVQRRAAGSFRVFSIGDRALPPEFIGLSVAAGATSTATFVVNPGLVYLYGWSGFVAIYVASTAGFFVGLVLFSRSFRQLGDDGAALSVPQWIGDRFGSPRLRVFYGVLSLLNVAYVVLIVVAMGQVLRKTLGVGPLAAVAFIIVFAASYILIGGARTHVVANVLQAGVMVIVAAILLASGWHHLADGLAALLDQVRSVGPHYGSVVNPSSQLYRDAFEVFAAQFVVGLIASLLPHLLSKVLYLRNDGEVRRYLGSTMGAVLLFKSVLLVGIAARLDLGGHVLPPDEAMATYLVERLSSFAQGFVSLGVLAAGFSTVEGILLSLSTIVANDIFGVLRGSEEDESARDRTSLFVSRVFIVLLVPVAIWLGYRQMVAPSLSVIIFGFHGILGLTLAIFVPILLGIYRLKPPNLWVLLSSLVGVGSYYSIVAFEVGKHHDNPMVPATFAALASLGSIGLARLVDRSSWSAKKVVS